MGHGEGRLIRVVPLFALGVIFVLVGFLYLTGRVEQWHKRYRQQSPKRSIPPFLTSLNQCIDCGVEGDLLNLERRCLGCHELKHG